MAKRRNQAREDRRSERRGLESLSAAERRKWERKLNALDNEDKRKAKVSISARTNLTNREGKSLLGEVPTLDYRRNSIALNNQPNTLGGWGIIEVKAKDGLRQFRFVKLISAHMVERSKQIFKIGKPGVFQFTARPAMKIGYNANANTAFTNRAVNFSRKAGSIKIQIEEKGKGGWSVQKGFQDVLTIAPADL